MADLPKDIAALRAALAAAEQRADQAEIERDEAVADAAHAKAKASGVEALVAHLTLQIEKLKRELWRLARSCTRDSPFAGKPFEAMHFDGASIRLRDDAGVSMTYADCIRSGGRDRLDAVYTLVPNVLKQRKFVRATFAAHFCEVRVDEAFGTVRVSRFVSAIDAGRIVNRLTATSQASGSVVWGIGHALHEETYDDAALGRFMNRSLAEYHVPVNADIRDLEIVFVEQPDTVVSRIGAKGVGEIGMVGVSAAVSNAVWHATGKRVRDTPMTPNRVMAD